MKRYNIFFPVHKGLRALLYETSLKLQQTVFTDAEEAAEMVDRIKFVTNIFESHAHKEDTYVFPAIADYEPAIVAAFENEHLEDYALGESLKKWLIAYEYAIEPSAKETIGEELSRAFIQFSVFNLKHMALEEEVINKILWRYYKDNELHALTLEIVKSIPPQEMADMNQWMLRGMNNAEVSGWLKEVKNSAPRPVFERLLLQAEVELNTNRWNIVKESLTDGAMLA